MNSRLDPSDFKTPSYGPNYFFLLQIIVTINDDNDITPRKFFPYLEYTFPDQDYCLYEDFAHHRLVIADIMSKWYINCSCTLFSLVKYYPTYYLSLNEPFSRTQLVRSCYDNNSDHDELAKKCNIKCNISQALPDYQAHYFDLYDLKNVFIVLKKWALLTLGPVACVLGCVSNSLVIFTIKSAARVATKRSKTPEPAGDQKHALIDSKQPLFVYMLINAIINLINSLLYFFYYVIKCDNRITGEQGFVALLCFIETVTVNILASILKLLANFTFLQVSMNRYALIGKDHFKFLVNFAGIKISKYVGSGILVSVALSVVVYFQQSFFLSSFDGKLFSEDYYNNNYFWYGESVYLTSMNKAYNSTVTKLQQLPYLSGFSMVHDLFSYFLFCVITTVIDATSCLE